MFENVNERDSNILYVGVVYDPWNTDNSWMETMAVLIHLDRGLSPSQLPVRRVSDLESAECGKSYKVAGHYRVEYKSGMSLLGGVQVWHVTIGWSTSLASTIGWSTSLACHC